MSGRRGPEGNSLAPLGISAARNWPNTRKPKLCRMTRPFAGRFVLRANNPQGLLHCALRHRPRARRRRATAVLLQFLLTHERLPPLRATVGASEVTGWNWQASPLPSSPARGRSASRRACRPRQLWQEGSIPFCCGRAGEHTPTTTREARRRPSTRRRSCPATLQYTKTAARSIRLSSEDRQTRLVQWNECHKTCMYISKATRRSRKAPRFRRALCAVALHQVFAPDSRCALHRSLEWCRASPSGTRRARAPKAPWPPRSRRVL